jgi:hypothetical protein
MDANRRALKRSHNFVPSLGLRAKWRFVRLSIQRCIKQSALALTSVCETSRFLIRKYKLPALLATLETKSCAKGSCEA